MRYCNLGRTGLKVSTLCLGTMQFGWTADKAQSFEILDHAIEKGCNFIDTADVYSAWFSSNRGGESENIIGDWLETNVIERGTLIIATKVRGKMGDGPNDQGLSRLHILSAVEASLRRLKTDYIDLYQVHWPDEETPMEETLRTLDDLVKSGKVRYIGCSNFPAWLLAKALWISDVKDLVRFDSLQPHYNYVHRAEYERDLQPLCKDQEIGVIPYSPLGGGFLTGKYRREAAMPDSARAGSVRRRYMNENGFMALDKLEEVGAKYDATIAQTAIAWILANQTVSSVIIGANNLIQLNDSFKGADIQLAPDDKKYLDSATSWRDQ